MDPIPLTHLFNKFDTLGGVESVLKYHYAHDREWELNSSFVIYSHGDSTRDSRLRYLNLGKRDNIRRARARFSEALAAFAPQIAVYHDVWGIPYLSDLDGAERRLLMVHSQVPDLEVTLSFRREWLDGVICIAETTVPTVRACLPNLSRERIRVLPYPISIPDPMPARSDLRERPIVIGFCGRLRREQKRVDRLPELCHVLDAQGVPYRLELLGEGEAEAWLREQLKDPEKFRFHGRQTGEAYWEIVQGWDVSVLTSDYEGTPISMLEALGVGVLPLYPRIHSGGDAYASAIDPKLLYPPYDFQHIAQTLAWLRRQSPDDIESLRRQARTLAEPHQGHHYLRQFAQFVHEIQSWPQVSQPTFPKRPFPVDFLSFHRLAQLGALRRAIRRYLFPPRTATPI